MIVSVKLYIHITSPTHTYIYNLPYVYIHIHIKLTSRNPRNQPPHSQHSSTNKAFKHSYIKAFIIKGFYLAKQKTAVILQHETYTKIQLPVDIMGLQPMPPLEPPNTSLEYDTERG